MDARVRSLFHELADLSQSEREKFFSEKSVRPDIRAEVESLLDFDVPEYVNEKQLGPYRLTRMLGTGGMSAVYLAERSDGEIEQTVAIKVLRTDIQRPAWRD